MPDPTNAFRKVRLGAGKKERDIYSPLLDAINDFGRCPSIRFVDTSNLPLDHGLGALKPDSCGYDEDELDLVTQEDGRIPANLGLAEILFEVKVDSDPFVDPAHNLREKNKLQEHNFVVYGDKGDLYKAKRTLGQNVAYAAEACVRQYRAFYFSVLIIGTRARFIRWDRAGAIVTRSFNYRDKPRYLCEFLWRFELATPEQRGYDPTVSVASKAEEIFFKKIISEHVAFESGIDEKTNSEDLANAVELHYQPGKVIKMYLYNEIDRTLEQYLVSHPIKSPISVAGRSTRGYWAVRLLDSGGEIAFLKDTWCNDAANIEIEGPIYGDMKAKDVVRISDLFCYGDVPCNIEGLREKPEASNVQGRVLSGQSESESATPNARNESEASADQKKIVPVAQCTRTNEFLNANWACNGCRGRMQVVKHTHFRMALKEVGYPLRDFTGTRELFDGAGDAFEALASAYEKCNRLHRDISLDNIILVRDKKTKRRRGILIDWELSTVVDEKGAARDHFRSGTWAYMSGAALEFRPDFRHTIADDMESVLYVVVYCTVRWLPHNDVENLGQWMHDFFDYRTMLQGRIRGGSTKRDCMQSGAFTEIFEFTDDLVGVWFHAAYEYLSTRVPVMQKYSIELQWVLENVRQLFRVTRSIGLPDGDRVNHKVDDFYKEIPSITYATHTSLAS